MSEFTDIVAESLKGFEAESVGLCPGCLQCADALGLEQAEFDEKLESGNLFDEAGFSRESSDFCGTYLAGDRWVWHAIHKESRELFHGDNCCTVCLMYLANGDEPENWRHH